MKKTVIMIFVVFVSFSCIEKIKNAKEIPESVEIVNMKVSESNKYSYNSDSLQIQLTVLKRTKQIEFDIDINTHKDTINFNEKADLILIEDEEGKWHVPEGSFVLDSSSNEEFICDSTYEYISDKICFSFGFEKSTNRRLSLVIYKSKVAFIKENAYTLHKK